MEKVDYVLSCSSLLLFLLCTNGWFTNGNWTHVSLKILGCRKSVAKPLLNDSKWSSGFICKCQTKYKTRYKLHPVHGSSALHLGISSSRWNNIVQGGMRPDLNKPSEDCLFYPKLSIHQSISLYFPVFPGFGHSQRSYDISLYLCKMALGEPSILSKLARKNTATTNCARSTNNVCLTILWLTLHPDNAWPQTCPFIWKLLQTCTWCNENGCVGETVTCQEVSA